MSLFILQQSSVSTASRVPTEIPGLLFAYGVFDCSLSRMYALNSTVGIISFSSSTMSTVTSQLSMVVYQFQHYTYCTIYSLAAELAAGWNFFLA